MNDDHKFALELTTALGWPTLKRAPARDAIRNVPRIRLCKISGGHVWVVARPTVIDHAHVRDHEHRFTLAHMYVIRRNAAEGRWPKPPRGSE